MCVCVLDWSLLLTDVCVQVAKAACLVLRHCVQGGEVSSGAKALGLLQGTQDTALFQRGGEAWKLFTNAGGAAALARVLPYPGASHRRQARQPQARGKDR